MQAGKTAFLGEMDYADSRNEQAFRLSQRLGKCKIHPTLQSLPKSQKGNRVAKAGIGR